MAIKTINVPFFGNAEHSANGGSVNAPEVDRRRKEGQDFKKTSNEKKELKAHKEVGLKKDQTNNVNGYS